MNRVSETRHSPPPQALRLEPVASGLPSPVRLRAAARFEGSAFAWSGGRPAFDRLASGGGEHLGNARACGLGFEAREPAEISRTEAPGACIQDLRTVTSKMRFDQEGSISQLKLNLDIDHSWRGDLVVQLTSPSGKTVDLSNRMGGGADGIKGDFDLSSAFKGEPLNGEWTLSVKDSSACDEGTLNAWSLAAAVR